MEQRRVDLIAVCYSCNLQFEITKAISPEDAREKAERYHKDISDNCQGELRTTVMLDTESMKGLPRAPESELGKVVRETLTREWKKRSRVH